MLEPTGTSSRLYLQLQPTLIMKLERLNQTQTEASERAILNNTPSSRTNPANTYLMLGSCLKFKNLE